MKLSQIKGMIILNNKFLSHINILFLAIVSVFSFTACSKKDIDTDISSQSDSQVSNSNQASLLSVKEDFSDLEQDLSNELSDNEADKNDDINEQDDEDYVFDKLNEQNEQDTLDELEKDYELDKKDEQDALDEDISFNENPDFFEDDFSNIGENSNQINNLIYVADIVQDAYDKVGAIRGWYSKGGRLSNYYTKEQITCDDLVKDSLLDSSSASDEYEFLLLDGKNISYFPNTSVPAGSMGFGVFVATKVDNNYIICSPLGKVATLSSENYVALLSLYNLNHGSAVKLSSASSEYARILNFINLFEGKFDEYFVREIRLDNKYAVVTLSSTYNVARIKQYVLRNSNEFWEVVFPDLQTVVYPVTTLNKYLPDFNFELLPSYNLATWQNNLTTNQDGALSALRQLNVLASNDEVLYMCATNSQAFIALHNGDKFCAYVEDGVWKAQQTYSDYEARSLFLAKTGMDYGFLILDD